MSVPIEMVFSDYAKRRILILRDRGKSTKEISELLLKEDIRAFKMFLVYTVIIFLTVFLYRFPTVLFTGF